MPPELNQRLLVSLAGSRRHLEDNGLGIG